MDVAESIGTIIGAPLFAAFLIFTRIGTGLAFLPGFGAQMVSVRIRLLLALAISVLLAPILGPTLPGVPASPAMLAVLLLSESLIGVFLATVVRIVFAALHVAGTFAAFLSSFANAVSQDPIAEQQSAAVSGFFGTLGLVLLFSTGLHRMLLRALVDSYVLLPVSAAPSFAAFAEIITHDVDRCMLVGLQLAAPFMVVHFALQVGFGIVNRMMPQLPVFFLGQPIQLSLQLWLMAATVTAVMTAFLSYAANVLEPYVLS